MLRRSLQFLLAPILLRIFSLSAKSLLLLYPRWKPRPWSNAELRRWAPLFRGDVINVSAWEDADKEGARYADYFASAASYTISNAGGARGAAHLPGELRIDLTEELPADQRRRYDVVFNHTTLEHIFDIATALRNLCSLSRDIVIVVVPFLQELHWEESSYGDFWRPSPFALQRLFEENGFELVHLAWNENPTTALYLFCIASRQAAKWAGVFPSFVLSRAGSYPGRSWSRRALPLRGRRTVPQRASASAASSESRPVRDE